MLEIACFNVSSAIAAARAGADRIELCSDYQAGGKTPAITSLQKVRENTTTPVNVMIRSRGGNFNYSETEFEQMKEEVQEFKPWASGFVFGILDEKSRVDEIRNAELIGLAAPLPCTFHRAIDKVDDLEEAVEKVIACGFKSILTSGGMKTATEGAARVAELQSTYGEKICLILGGGVRSLNASELKSRTSVAWLHSAAIVKSGEDVDEEEVAKIREA